MKVYVVKVNRILEMGKVIGDSDQAMKLDFAIGSIVGVCKSQKECIRKAIEDFKYLCKEDSEYEVNPVCDLIVSIDKKTIEPYLDYMYLNIKDSENKDNPEIEYYIQEFELENDIDNNNSNSNSNKSLPSKRK